MSSRHDENVWDLRSRLESFDSSHQTDGRQSSVAYGAFYFETMPEAFVLISLSRTSARISLIQLKLAEAIVRDELSQERRTFCGLGVLAKVKDLNPNVLLASLMKLVRALGLVGTKVELDFFQTAKLLLESESDCLRDRFSASIIAVLQGPVLYRN